MVITSFILCSKRALSDVFNFSLDPFRYSPQCCNSGFLLLVAALAYRQIGESIFGMSSTWCKYICGIIRIQSPL